MVTQSTSPQYLTPTQIAKRLQIKVDKVHRWIESGELRALNMATNPKGQRPRYKVRAADYEAFEIQREVRGSKPTPRRRAKPAGLEEFI